MDEQLPDIDQFGGTDPLDTGGGKKPLPSIDSLNIDSSEGLRGIQQGYRYDEFDRKFFGQTRRFQPKLGADNARLRAGDQSGWEQAGLFLGNMIPNIAGSLVENVGYLAALGSEWGDDRDYNNALTQLGKTMRNPAGELYRERPDVVWDPSDPAWWYQNAASLVESATAFAVTGIGMAKLLSWIPKAVKAMGAGANLVKGARGLQQLSTAAGLAYTEGAMSGSRVFDKTYETQLQNFIDQGLSDEDASKEAIHRASQAAAASVQLNTMVNTALNLTAISPLFREAGDSKAWFRTHGKAKPGESYDAWTQRIKNLSVTDPDIRKLLNPRNTFARALAREMPQEGLEEMVNQWAENRGMERGANGKTLKGLGELLGDMEEFFNDTMNEEGALNFVLGAVGGGAQTVLIDAAPVNKVYLDEKGNITDRRFDAADPTTGKYQTKIVSTKYKNALGGRNYFNNIKDTIVKDINRIQELTDNLEKAVAANKPLEIEKAKMKLFDAGALNAVTLGIGDAFAKQYQEIADLDNENSLHEAYAGDIAALDQAIQQETDPTAKKELEVQRAALIQESTELIGITEAMQKGYASDMSDNTYKKTAQEAIDDIKYYEELWKSLDKKYRTGDEWDSHYADYLFNKEVEARRKQNIIRKAEAELATAELNRAATLHPDEDALLGPIVSDLIADTEAKTKLIDDAKAINRAWIDLKSGDETKVESALKTLKEIAETYLPNAESEDDLESATADVAKKLKAKIDEIDSRNNQRAQDINDSPGFLEWKQKNSKGSVVEYLKQYRKNKSEDMALERDKSELAEFKAETEISNSYLAELKSSKGKKQYIKKAKATRNKLIQSIKEKTEKDNENSIHRLFDPVKAKDLDNLQRVQFAASLSRERETTVERLNQLIALDEELSAEIDTIQKKGLVVRAVNTVKFNQLIKKRASIRSQITIAQNKIANLDGQIELLQTTTIPTEALIPTPKPSVLAADVKSLVAGIDFRFKNEVAALPIMDEDDAIYIGTQLAWEALEDEGNAVTTLPKEEQTKYMDMLNDYVRNVMIEYGKIKTEEEENNPLQELIDIIASVKFGARKQAELLADLAEFKRMLDTNHAALDNRSAADFLRALGYVGKGKLSEKKAKEIETVFNRIHNIDVNPVKSEIPEPVDVAKPDIEVKTNDIPSEFPEDSNEGQPSSQDLVSYTSLELEVIAHKGIKTVDTAKVGTLTHEYEQDIEKADDGDYYYVNKDLYFLNEYVNPLYLEPGKITAGTKVRLVPDMDWIGSVNSKEAFVYGAPVQINDSINKYMENNRALSLRDELVGNFPIKIVDVTSGTTIGYVHRLDWIQAQYPNKTGDYRNVENVIYNSEGELVTDNNVQEESDKMLLLRKKIAIAFNNGMKDGLETTITKRRRGQALRTRPTKASEALPDTSLKLALLGKEAVKINAQEPVDANRPEYLANPKGAYPKGNIPGVLIPDASGRLNFEPLWTNKLGKAEVDTAIRAIEIYLTLGNSAVNQAARETAEDHAKEIEETTGFDIRTHQGLKGFINQFYFYTRGYNDQEMTANAKALDGAARIPEFKLAISESIGEGFAKAYIKAGVTFLNKSVKAAVDTNGKINEEFSSLLHDKSVGLQSKFRNVIFSRVDKNLRGINSTGPVTELVFQPRSNNFRKVEYSSYNDLVLQNSLTTLYGKLKLDSGSYVYYANPTTQFNYQEVMDRENIVSRQQQTSPADITAVEPGAEQYETDLDKVFGTKPEEDPARQAYLDNLDTNLEDEIMSVRPVVQSAGNVPGKAISLEYLTELRNFTPAENRNSLSPAEAMEQLISLGLTTIPEGYNPFYSC